MIDVEFRGTSHTMVDGITGERGAPGALHLLPRSMKSITEDEYRWIEAHRPDVFALLLVRPKPTPKVKPVAEESKKEEPVAVDEAKEHAPEAEPPTRPRVRTRKGRRSGSE